MKIPEREQGQGLVEYALLLVLIAIVVLVILTLLGTQVVLVMARVVGGFNGDVIDVANGDRAVMLTYDANSDCSQIFNIRFIEVDTNGALKTNVTISGQVYEGATPRGSVNATAGSNGLGTHTNPITVSGCNNLHLLTP